MCFNYHRLCNFFSHKDGTLKQIRQQILVFEVLELSRIVLIDHQILLLLSINENHTKEPGMDFS